MGNLIKECEETAIYNWNEKMARMFVRRKRGETGNRKCVRA